MRMNNQSHPELRPGEIFFGNYPSQSQIDKIEGELKYFSSKRFGDKSYDEKGGLMNGFKPAFVLKEESDLRNSADFQSA
jgi:hypothetical protein